MKTLTRTFLPALLAALLVSPAFADKGGKHGYGNDQGYEQDRGHGKGHERRDDRDDDRRDDRRHGDDRRHFDDSYRLTISNYYVGEIRSGHCPPGLAKKHNGCQAPGQAKKWRRGYALPYDVVRYPLPSDLLRRLPPPPRGHEYVRVAGDVLMIAVGSSMVVDALEDLIR